MKADAVLYDTVGDGVADAAATLRDGAQLELPRPVRPLPLVGIYQLRDALNTSRALLGPTGAAQRRRARPAAQAGPHDRRTAGAGRGPHADTTDARRARPDGELGHGRAGGADGEQHGGHDCGRSRLYCHGMITSIAVMR